MGNRQGGTGEVLGKCAIPAPAAWDPPVGMEARALCSAKLSTHRRGGAEIPWSRLVGAGRRSQDARNAEKVMTRMSGTGRKRPFFCQFSPWGSCRIAESGYWLLMEQMSNQ